MLSLRGSLVLGCVVAGCASAPAPDTQRAHPRGSAEVTSAAEPPASTYLPRVPPRSQVGRSFPLPDGTTGFFLGTRRAVFDPKAPAPIVADDPVAVHRAMELTKGDGFLFFTSLGLARAKEFAGPLEQLTTGTFQSVWVGPGFVLTRDHDGERQAIDLTTRQPRKGLPVGLVAVASDGALTVGLAEGGRTLRSTDRGATWKDVTADLAWTPTRVELVEGEVVVSSASLGQAARATASSFDPRPIPRTVAPRTDESGWPSSSSPLEAVARRGAAWSEGRAIVAEGGSVFVVSLRSGAIVEREPGVLPPDQPCDATSTSKATLFICPTNFGPAVYQRRHGTKKTELDRSFSTHGTFHRGAGDSLLFTAPCSGAGKIGVACVRKSDGAWTEIGRPEVGDAPPDAPLQVAAWIPKEDGALLLVSGKQGGLWDATSADRTSLEEADVARIRALLSGASTTIVDRFSVTSDGSIVGLGSDSAGFRITKGGKVIERSPFRFHNLGIAGRHVLAYQQDRLWQSSDWGMTFAEVEPPPPPASPVTPACSEVGCVLHEWVRVGWDATPPSDASARPTRSTHANPPPARDRPLPTLRCVTAGAATRRVATKEDERPGFGPETLRLLDGDHVTFFPRGYAIGPAGTTEAANLRAALTGRVPEVTREGASFGATPPLRLRTLTPFDPKGAVQDGTVRLSDLLDAARSVGGGPPDVTPAEHRGHSLIVLSDPPSTLLAPPSAPLLWVRGRGAPLALSLGADPRGLTVVAAVQTGPDELTALAQDYTGAGFLRVLSRGRAEEAAISPPTIDGAPTLTPDSLAVGPDGRLGVLRIPTRTPPSQENPAFLLRPGTPPQPLAPWSTLAADGTPACEGMKGHRAVVATPSAWITTGIPLSGSVDAISFARVRWGTDRICLEAIELHAHEYDLGHITAASYMVARFGKDPAAGHLFTADGSELREPRSCTLDPTPR